MDDFILLPTFILEDKSLNYAQKILFWVILKLLKKEKKCHTTDEELGEILNSNCRSIRRNIYTLVEKWYIWIVGTKMSQMGQKCPTRYDKWELRKTARIITLGQKCPPYIYNIYSIYNTSSKKEEKNIRKEEMLEAFRNDGRFTRFMDEEDVIRWWDFKQSSKKPYKDVKTFITALVKIMNVIKNYWDMPKSDRNRRNRFNYAVNEAIERGWEWLNWYDNMEQVYESSKDDLYPTPKQNE